MRQEARLLDLLYPAGHLPPFQVAPFHLEGRQDRKGAERVAVALQKLQHMDADIKRRFKGTRH